jgi:uncharacterized protein with beta-barrel porin domain
LSAAWGHQFQGSPDNLSAGLSSGGPFTVQGPATGSEEVLLGAGLSVPLAPGLSGALDYRGVFARTHFDSQSFSGGLALGF